MEEQLRRAMTVVQEFVQGSGELESTLRAVTSAATDALGASMAGLTIRDDRGRLTTVVQTDDVVADLDTTQYAADRGPCIDAARTGAIFEIDDTRTDDRWPEFASVAADRGIYSSLSMPIVVAGDGVGALNFYDRRSSYFDEPKRQAAAPFAGQCAVAGLYWSAASEAAGLAKAMESRAVIEQAKGVLMATTRCSASEAFDLLREQSQSENRKLREIAQEIVDRQHG